MKKFIFTFIFYSILGFTLNAQDIDQILTNQETEHLKEAATTIPESYSFIVNRRIYKLNSIFKDETPYFSIDSIFYPLSLIGMEINKNNNNYEIVYEEKKITLYQNEGICFIPKDPEPEPIAADKILTESEKQEQIKIDNLRQKKDLRLEITSILENKQVYLTSDFFISVLSKIIKKQIAYDPNTGTFFIGKNSEIKINYGIKEEKDYSVLKMLCPAQIKYKVKTEENLMTISINSTFNIDKNDFKKIESNFFTVEDVYFEKSKTIIKLLLSEKVHKTYNTFDNNFSTLKLYFYSEEYYNPNPIVNTKEIYQTNTSNIKTIVIDPGHGGDDIGAKGTKGVEEKEITLAIAFKLSKILKIKGYNVVMTRYSDIFVPLKERTGIANNNKGDIFISIHVNASVRKAYGAETYYLSLKGMDQVSDTVAFENREIAKTQKNPEQEENDTKEDLMFILWDMAQTEYLKDSAGLAEEIQKSMNELTGVRDRGVKQASLVVLKGLNMPGVLIEVAFLSNPQEETRLTTDLFQQNTAMAIADSINSYKIKYEEKMQQTKEIDGTLNNENLDTDANNE